MNNLQKTVVLALIQALCDHAEVPKGRLQSQLNQIEKRCREQFAMLPRLTDSEVEKLRVFILAFESAVGWDGGERHVLTYTNFLLAVLDEYQIFTAKQLIEINQYFERKDNDPAACYDDGLRAAEILMSMIGELA